MTTTTTANIQLADCLQAGGVTLERVKYFQRQLLTVDDMVTDQDYFRQKMRRHNRFLHGWGVVCGLIVTAAPTSASPWRVQIGAGYALGPYGDEIYVSDPVFLDLASCAANTATNPCSPGSSMGARGIGGVVYVAIEYAECFSQPVQTMPLGCGCADDGCEYSRIRDSFDLCCLTTLPPRETVPSICDLIARKLPAPCPPCPTSPWVVLAEVTLPSITTMNLTNDSINTSIRKVLYRTELLQAQLVAGCGQATVQPVLVPVRVVSSSIAAGATFSGNGSPSNIVLTLSKSVQPATVNTNSVFVTNAEGKALAGAVVYSDANHTITFSNSPATPGVANTAAGLPAPSAASAAFPPDTYTVTAKGAAPNAIVDTDNLALDGNSDGTGGDNYTLKFTVTPGLSLLT